MLKILGLCKVFNTNTINENKVFDNFNVDIKKGEFVTIIGSNGAGKSTLLNLISGNISVDSGLILLDGKDVSHKDEFKRAKQIGRVYQNPSLGVSPNMTILENLSLADNKGKRYGLSFGINKKRIDYYKELLTKIDLGLENKLYNKVTLLSGGQRQRISIARAFLKDAPIILMDEATASLDVDNESMIQESISKLIENKTVLIIAHRMRTVDGVDQIVVLKDGVVFEQGKPQDLKQQNGIYKHMVEMQMQSHNWKYE